jgi:hypothetical protein
MPQKIDFFALTLLEIIKRSNQFRNKSIAEILLLLEIPNDLHNIFEDRINGLFNKTPKMIDLDRSRWSALKDGVALLQYTPDVFVLTKIGEEAYQSKELIEETKKMSAKYVYDTVSNALLEERNTVIQPENEAIVLDVRTNETKSELTDIFTSIISKNVGKYIQGANSKTKIFEMRIAPTNLIVLRDNIEINLADNKLLFTHKNENVLNAFLNLPQKDKDTIRSKMFCYFDIPQIPLNLDKATIVTKREIKEIKMKVVFGEEQVLSKLRDNIFSLPDGNDFEFTDIQNYTFAGITENNQPLVYKYSEMTENGYTIPLEEVDNSNAAYSQIFAEAWEQCKQAFADDNDTNAYIARFALLAAPKERKESIIREIAETCKSTNDIINTLLELDEQATVKSLELVKLYNELLDKETLSSINHKSNLYSQYADYYRQVQKLKEFGFENFYNYSIPKDWNAFMKEVVILKKLFEKLEDKLTASYKKSATDFFTKVEDAFYDLAPIDKTAGNALLKSDNWQKDVNVALNSKNPNFQAIATIIRGKFAEKFRAIEKNKDGKSDDLRKGKELITFVLDAKQVNEAYKHWKNLCILVHPETSPDQQLTKAQDSAKKQALQNALNYYKSIFKEDKK